MNFKSFAVDISIVNYITIYTVPIGSATKNLLDTSGSHRLKHVYYGTSVGHYISAIHFSLGSLKFRGHMDT